MKAYCVKCKTKREMDTAQLVFTSNGSPATRGTCQECGTGMFKMDRDAILAFWHANEDAHARALAIEYKYLHKVIYRLFNVLVDIGALVVANASDWDLDLLFESDVEIPLFKPDDEQIRQAAELLARLRVVSGERAI